MMSAKQKLGLFDFTMIMVSFVIGMGIFRTPVNVAAASPNAPIFYAAWIAGGFIALCGALTFAEIGSRFPVTGAYYKIFSYAYHPSIAFAVNCIILISNAASLAGVALIGAEYLATILDSRYANSENLRMAIAIGSIILFYGINLLGLRMSAKTQNILTIIKIGLVILLITPLFFAHTNHTEIVPIVHDQDWTSYIKAFGIGLVAVSFTYGGYQQAINFGEEVENPSRNIPRGIFIGLCIIILLYLSINIAYVNIIGFEQLKSANGIAALMAGHVLGSAAGNLLSVLLFLSVLAYVNVLLMSNPRVMQAMSEEGVLPQTFAKRTRSKQVLFTSLTAFASLCILIVFWAKTFDEILSFSIFLDCFGMILSAGTLFVLRKKTANLDQTGIYKMKLFPLMPLLFMAAYVFVGVSIFLDKPSTAITGLIILALFTGLFFLVRRIKK